MTRPGAWAVLTLTGACMVLVGPRVQEGAGKADVPHGTLTISMTFASFDDYWTPFLGGQGPAGAYVTSLGESQREALKARLRQRLLAAGPDRSFTLEGCAWAVKGSVQPK